MTQVNRAQARTSQLALRKRATVRSLAERRADFTAQMRAMALSDLSDVSRRLKDLHAELERATGRQWTQYELADKLGIPHRTFQSWENGEVENRDGQGYDKMARFYSRRLERKISRNWILFGDESQAKGGRAASDGGASKSRSDTDLLQKVSEQVLALVSVVAALESQVQELSRKLPEPGEGSAGE